MSIVKFNRRRFPWHDAGMTNWLDTDDFFADDFFTRDRNLPAMNVKENDGNFDIELAVPGYSKEDIEVSMENDMLHVCAQNKEEEADEDDKGYTRKEFSYRSFDHLLKLPSTVNQDMAVKATYKHGILKLTLLKNAQAKEPSKKVIEIS
ncbi:MAG: Hsp20/alpha crystallin family protein [Bacteroidetes bacterium]|nr:MAG: Hsp20/alpha crystallin family protein [Bacteroidota bacterium]